MLDPGGGKSLTLINAQQDDAPDGIGAKAETVSRKLLGSTGPEAAFASTWACSVPKQRRLAIKDCSSSCNIRRVSEVFCKAWLNLQMFFSKSS
jgi:hypothetical protein